MVRRIAVIDKEKCNPIGCGDYLCIRMCPLNRMGKEAIVKGPNGKAQINEDIATDACQVCVNICPFGAIHMVKLPEKLTSRPIHRYGKDGFTLFNLPLPQFGEVLGLIGKNGIGKSTAIKVLASVLQPNLGEPESKGNFDGLMKMYKGTEAYLLLDKIKKGEIRVSYKPQAVTAIPDHFHGSVHELLEKADQRHIISQMIDSFELNPILEKDICAISGGELQRVAIAATIMRDANLYFFDEPTSFLDITHRIAIAKLIRSLAEKGNAVVVVEHDLASLDYLSDNIQVLYGEPAVYGILSQVKPVRRGINEYLDGFLPDDNIRFRSTKITFYRGVEAEVKDIPAFAWPTLEKSFPSFHLTVNHGYVRKGEVLTVTGANGLGKTSFLKIIAGILPPDKGRMEKKIMVAYKPQDLVTESGTVLQFLEKTQAEKESGWFKQNILEKLNLKAVLNNDISSLSGGELQRVWIAYTLCQNADLYAFDEPSAFIDVEDRLKVAEVIREFMIRKETAAIVVDHDVQFLDYCGDSMIVFGGIPGKEGSVIGPLTKRDGMNEVLKVLDITYRMDKESGRPRINKPGSQRDREQKQAKQYYST